MKRIREIDFSLVTHHPKMFLFFSLLVGIFFIAFNPYVKTVNNVDYFEVENDPHEAFYQSFKEEFGNDEFFIIAYEPENLFTPASLKRLQDITRELEEIEEIDSVTSLGNVDDVVGSDDYFDVSPFMDEIPEDPAALEALKQRAVNNPLYVDNFVSKDGKTAAILVEVLDRPEDENYRKRLIEKTKTVLSKYKRRKTEFHLSGWTITNISLSKYLNEDVAVFVPATYLLITLTVWFFFRNWVLTLLAVINISISLGATRGFMGLTGITLNNVTIITIPLVMALALCDTVHIFSQLSKEILNRLPNKADALSRVLSQVFFPCFLTTLTTAVGFLSLAVSDIPPIRQFAWVAASGMVFEFFFSFLFLPPLMMLFKPEKIFRDSTRQISVTRLLKKMTGFIHQHCRLVVTLAGVVLVVFLWGAGRMKVETNLIKFFKKSTPIRVSIDFVENRLAGVTTMDVSLSGDDVDVFKDPSNLRVIEQVQQFLSTLEGVDKTLSFVDFLKDMNASFHNENQAFYRIPESKEMVSQYMLIYASDETENFVNSSYNHARISARLSDHSSAGQKRIVERLQRFMATLDPPGIHIRVTGRVVKGIHTVDALVRGQIYSLSIAAGVISLIMFLVFRSIAVAFLSMLPNFFPIVVNFGIMGFAHIALDTGTALIAAVALGIAVDDTIHFLSDYQKRRNSGETVFSSIQSTIEVKGKAIVSSSVILSFGFGVMVLSRFVPTIHFGLLSAIIMITALIGDIVVLPAVLFLKKE